MVSAVVEAPVGHVSVDGETLTLAGRAPSIPLPLPAPTEATVARLFSLELSHKVPKGHCIRQGGVTATISIRVHMPATRVVGAIGPTALADQGKGSYTRLFVMKDIHEAAGQDIDAQADRGCGQTSDSRNGADR